MPIVQAVNSDPDQFQIVLPDAPSPEQRALKALIDDIAAQLAKRLHDATLAVQRKKLRDIAMQGFEEVGGAKPDLQAATAAANAMKTQLTRPDPQGSDPKPEQERPQPADARRGGFRVTLPTAADVGVNPREIIFNVRGPTPPDQLKLKSRIEETLTILQAIFPDTNWQFGAGPKSAAQRRFEDYQSKLLGIAQVGLQTPADPAVATAALDSLELGLLALEGPRVKNGYMKVLGMWAIGFAFAAAVIYFMSRWFVPHDWLLYAVRNVFVLWVGTMIGTWLSFGIRRAILTLKDLSNLESDMVEPAIRLIFTGLIAETIGLIFICAMVNVDVGGLHSADLLNHGSRALLIGILLGVSEQALPGTLTRRASQFVSDIGGKA